MNEQNGEKWLKNTKGVEIKLKKQDPVATKTNRTPQTVPVSQRIKKKRRRSVNIIHTLKGRLKIEIK